MEQKDKINKVIVEAMTDEELFSISAMIKEEIHFRHTDFLTIPHFSGGIGTDARTPQH